MKTFITLIAFALFTSLSYADDSSGKQQAMKDQLENLIKLDKQIENLQKQKLEDKAEVAQHLERGSVGILPGTGRRQSRRAEKSMEEVQDLNQQIEALEEQRQTVLRALK